jgi:hypothetical protein
MKYNLFTMTNAKTNKGEKLGVLTGILYLAPAKISGYEVCPRRTAGCTKSCLYSAGRGKFSNVQKARINRTKLFFENRELFLSMLRLDIRLLEIQAKEMGMIPAVRLNGTSDIDWTRFGLMEEFPNVRFYDYTKVLNRLKKIPPNYYVTFSRAESNEIDSLTAIKMGHNVSVVFNLGKNDQMPDTWNGAPVYDGDETDARFLDPQGGYIIGLRAKGQAKKDESGFVVNLN